MAEQIWDPSGRHESPWGDTRRYGGTPGGIGPVGALELGAGADAGITGGIPLSIIIPIAISLLSGLFGKKEDPLSEAMDLKRQMGILGFKEPYQSPYIAGADRTMYQALLNQMKRTSNWGWPAGMGMDTSFIEDALAQFVPGPGGIRQIQRS